MFAEFIKHSFIYGLGKAGTVLFGLLTLPILTAYLSPEDFGILELLSLVLVFLNLTVALEVSQAIARFMADCKTQAEKAAFTSTAFLFSVFAYGVTSLILAVFSTAIAQWIFDRSDFDIYVRLLIPWFFLNGVTIFFMNQFRWDNRPKTYIVLQNLRYFLLLLFIFLFLYGAGFGLIGALYANIFSLFFVALVGGYLLVRWGSLAPIFDRHKLAVMLLFSIPLVPSSISVFLQNYVDRIMVAKYLDVSALGYYGLAFKIAGALFLFSSLFQTAIVPLIYKHYKKKTAPHDIAKSCLLFLFFMLAGITGISFFLPEIFLLLIDSSFYSAAILVPVLCMSVLSASIYIYAPGLVIEKKTGYLAVINFLGMLLNVALNIWFLHMFGLIGVAYATVISQSLTGIVHFYVSHKYYPIPFAYGKILASIILTLLAVIILYRAGTFEILIFSAAELIIRMALFGSYILILGCILLPMRDFEAAMKVKKTKATKGD